MAGLTGAIPNIHNNLIHSQRHAVRTQGELAIGFEPPVKQAEMEKVRQTVCFSNTAEPLFKTTLKPSKSGLKR